MIALRQSLYKSERVFNTGENPILITCTDFTDWVCKHGRNSTSTLFNEVIGSSFAKLWNLVTPPISFIKVENDHIPDNVSNIVQPIFFNKPCFGSFYIENSQVIDNTLLPSFRKASFRNKLVNKKDLLKIALFDIWLGNEDRNHNNSNLLLDQSISNKYYFSVFDHGAIFNSNALRHGLELISDNESLIYTEFAKVLFGKVNNLTEIVDNIVKDFYLCITKCENNLSNILANIPLEWGLDIENIENLLRTELFNLEWYENCQNHFRTLIQTNILN